MKVQTVTVEIHEKRNHPNAYGHYDARVNYTVQVDDGEDATEVVGQYQFIARQQVADECDRWEREIKLEVERESARGSLQWIVDRADNGQEHDSDADKFEKSLALLPAEEQAEWRTRWVDAKAQWQKTVKTALDELITFAEKEELRPHRVANYDRFIAALPESERQGYIDRMADAVAAYEASQAPVQEQANNA